MHETTPKPNRKTPHETAQQIARITDKLVSRANNVHIGYRAEGGKGYVLESESENNNHVGSYSKIYNPISVRIVDIDHPQREEFKIIRSELTDEQKDGLDTSSLSRGGRMPISDRLLGPSPYMPGGQIHNATGEVVKFGDQEGYYAIQEMKGCDVTKPTEIEIVAQDGRPQIAWSRGWYGGDMGELSTHDFPTNSDPMQYLRSVSSDTLSQIRDAVASAEIRQNK